MLSLSPIKILIVVVVALLLVGPDKLPQVARQIGAAWRAFRGFTTKVEEEVRSTMPDLPKTSDIARFARSPVALLDSLGKLDNDALKPDPGGVTQEAEDHLIADPGAPAPKGDDEAGPAEPNPREFGSIVSEITTAASAKPRQEPNASVPFDPNLN